MMSILQRNWWVITQTSLCIYILSYRDFIWNNPNYLIYHFIQPLKIVQRLIFWDWNKPLSENIYTWCQDFSQHLTWLSHAIQKDENGISIKLQSLNIDSQQWLLKLRLKQKINIKVLQINFKFTIILKEFRFIAIVKSNSCTKAINFDLEFVIKKLNNLSFLVNLKYWNVYFCHV